MNARQARSLLELIADLYTVANTPEPSPPPPAPVPNSKPQKATAKPEPVT